MNSSLHPLAASEELDLGAFLYATRRLPDEVADAKVIVMGQEAIVFKRAGIGPIEDWEPLEAPARRRRWFHDGDGTLAVLLASASDLDDLIPTLVAYQIEWNKMRVKMRAADVARRRPDAGRVRRRARRLGGGLVAAARRVGRRLRRAPARRRRAAAQPARADARRQRRRLRAHDAPLVAAGAAHARGAGAAGAADLLRLLQRALDRQPPHRHRARARGGDHRLGRALRRPGPQARARPLPLRRGRGLVGELPLLRRARVLHRAPRGLRHLRAALARGARGRRHAPLEHDRAARVGAGHRPRRGSTPPRSTRGSASPTPRGWPPATR